MDAYSGAYNNFTMATSQLWSVVPLSHPFRLLQVSDCTTQLEIRFWVGFATVASARALPNLLAVGLEYFL